MRNRVRVILLVPAVLLLAAAIGYLVWLFEPPPAYRVDVEATPWRIVAIDDERVDSDRAPTLRFLPRGTVQLTLRCGTGTSEIAMDTDGHALSFVGFTFDGAVCRNLTGDDHSVVAALMDVESWSVVDDETIELHGPRALRLERDHGEATP